MLHGHRRAGGARGGGGVVRDRLISTVGAAHRWVTPSARRSARPRPARPGAADIVPPPPVTPQVKHHRCSGTWAASRGSALPPEAHLDQLAERARGRRRGACRPRPWRAGGAARVVNRDRPVLAVGPAGRRRPRRPRAALRTRPRAARRAGRAAPRPPARRRLEASGSSTSTCAAQCSTMKRTSGGARRVLIAHSTPPEAGTPKCASSSSRLLSESIATRSPGSMPSGSQRSCRAATRARCDSANESVRSPSRTAGRWDMPARCAGAARAAIACRDSRLCVSRLVVAPAWRVVPHVLPLDFVEAHRARRAANLLLALLLLSSSVGSGSSSGPRATSSCSAVCPEVRLPPGLLLRPRRRPPTRTSPAKARARRPRPRRRRAGAVAPRAAPGPPCASPRDAR